MVMPQRVLVTPDNGAEREFVGGNDATTRADFRPRQNSDRGGQRQSIVGHPPWTGGTGSVAGEWRILLPQITPITFTTGLAIRDSGPNEGVSDGVTFRLRVDGEPVLDHHTDSKVWVDLEQDLSAYAGREIALRLELDPGPERNTSSDSAHLGAPQIFVGPRPQAEPAEAKGARAASALVAARAARAGRPTETSWRLESEAGVIGAAVVPGPGGLVDAQIAFASADDSLLIDGMEIQLSNAPLLQRQVAGGGDGYRADATGLIWTYTCRYEGQEAVVLAAVRPRAGALEVSVAVRGDRRPDGHPRLTRIAFGPGSEVPRRVYYGHGNVVQDPSAFSLGYNGFRLSTRHVGFDYPGGLSLLQATDVVPNALEFNPATRQATLSSVHDTNYLLVPSDRGAMAAARVWRGINGLRAAPGVAELAGMMCLDQWGGDYGRAADDLERATRYGLDRAVFVKHAWQRWGYDYRLPDIWPPQGNRADFDRMIRAAGVHGRLMCLHDNYIDFYPDADGYTYDEITFNPDGSPQKAWINEGRGAQSYRWLPSAFRPYLARNLDLIFREVGPVSYFIDVFSAMAPHDGYDRAGNYFTRNETARIWGDTFDYVRERLRGPTISEAGTDILIGHLDGAQADHGSALSASFGSNLTAAATDRTPWFDMAHHGRFILFAGGLGPRYAGDLPADRHGYGTDDYLTLTALGGRTPMSDGPFSRRAVMTYWLLQPLCESLERQEMLAHEFLDDQVTRQRVTWPTGTVTVNRGPEDITVDGHVLPEYGMIAQVGAHQVDISRRDGIVSARAESPGWLFVDARSPSTHRYYARTAVTGFEDQGNRNYAITMDWNVLRQIPADIRPFIHMTGELEQLPGATRNADILWQTPSGNIEDVIHDAPAEHEVVVMGTLPEGLRPGRYGIRYGIYEPSGSRHPLDAPADGGGRHDGGEIVVEGEGDAATITWVPPTPQPPTNDNVDRRVLDFGPVQTNLAARLTTAPGSLQITLLPDSTAGEITVDLAHFDLPAQIEAVEQLDEFGAVVGEVPYELNTGRLTIQTADEAFAYRVRG